MSSELLEVCAWAFFTGLLSALATGLGVIPVALIKSKSSHAKAWAGGLAAGMMTWASLEAIIGEAWTISPKTCLLGIVLGVAFLLLAEYKLPTQGENKRGLILWLVMLIHSFPEGLAIGVGFASGNLSLGIMLALVISLHNIPEGLAISLALRSDGASLKKCFWFSVLSSVPQPIVAVPAAILVGWAQGLVPAGLGFAGGAMILVAFHDLLPQTIKTLGYTKTLGACFSGGSLMAALSYIVESLLAHHPS